MKCVKCHVNFCWVCLEVMNTYNEPHICHRYDPANSVAEDDSEKRALFTVTRFEGHEMARIFTANQYKHFDTEKFIETYWFIDEMNDPDIMRGALQTLLTSRDFLKHSYVKILFLKEDDDSIIELSKKVKKKTKKLYEDHHACLEMLTERLSYYTEINLHQHYELRGQYEINLHFRRLAFYTASVVKYMERMICL